MRSRIATALAVVFTLGAPTLVIVAWRGAQATVRRRAVECDMTLRVEPWVEILTRTSMALAAAAVAVVALLILTRRDVVAALLTGLLIVSLGVWGLGIYSVQRDAPTKPTPGCSA